MNKYRTFAYLILAVALAVSVKTCRSIAEDRARLRDNQRALLEDARYYRTRDSLSAASVERLLLTADELKRHNADLVKTCADLNVKVRRLQSASTTATVTAYPIDTPVRDSLVLRDSLRIDTLQCVAFRNPYLTFSGCFDGGRFIGEIETRDTLVHVVHRVPRRFLFFRYGTKGIRQEVISKNPYSTIVYSAYIELKR